MWVKYAAVSWYNLGGYRGFENAPSLRGPFGGVDKGVNLGLGGIRSVAEDSGT